MKAITFLGTNKYSETTYHFGDKVASVTNLFPKVICEFFAPTELLVLVTENAKEMWFEELQKQIACLGIKITPIDIPDGHLVEDLWEIFSKLTENLNKNEEVIFDITHSFRTLPFLAFLAASYLRVAKNVDIKGIYYGAFDARIPQPPPDKPSQSNPSDRSPVFDLTPFLDLLNWTTATDKFIASGNARELADLLKKSHRTLWKNRKRDNANLPKNLQNLGSILNNLSLSLALSRPAEISKQSAELEKKLESAKDELEQWTKPFVLLLEKVKENYSQFSKNDLETQRKLIGWFIEHERINQSVTLAREWIVSVVCKQMNYDVLTEREKGETLLYQEIERRKEKIQPEHLSKELLNAWSEISDLRNDLAHCGFRSHPRPSNTILNSVKRLPNLLNSINLDEL